MSERRDASAECELGEFRASDGYRLRYRRWAVSPQCRKGIVLSLHGVQSHSGWYGWSSARLAAAGFEVIFADRRGSGLNAEDRGHAVHAERLISDVVQLLGEVDYERRTSGSTIPLVLLAVSWGAKLAVSAAVRRPELMDGLALLYPGICARVRPNVVQRWLLKLAVAGGQARRLIDIPLGDPELFTSEEQWQRYIKDDPLALHRATAGFLAASIRLDELAAKAPARLVCPVLMMLAGEDDIIDNAASQRYFERLATKRGTLVEYRSARHTLEFEPCREEFVSDLLVWLQRLASSYEGMPEDRSAFSRRREEAAR